MSFTPASIDALRALFLGFAFAGLMGSAYEFFMCRRLGFETLQKRDATAFAAVPVLVFTAPFIIIRAILRDGGTGRRSFAGVLGATAVAGFWSIVCGRVVLEAAGRLLGA